VAVSKNDIKKVDLPKLRFTQAMKNKISKLLFIFNLFVSTSIATGQPWKSPYNLHPPLAGPLFLSGSFGEIRTNSFHAGIDFRTGGKVGAKVFASEDGFISRIRISGVGFGKAIYIQHPNGITTVYAHLDRFAKHIDEFVKEHQYRQKSFDVDIYLKSNDIKVKRGEFIATSGNTGSSGGPHLHYEVRRTEEQIPLNPLFSNLPIIDTIPPFVNSAWIYPLDSASLINHKNKKLELFVQGKNKRYAVKDTIRATGNVGFGIKTYDYLSGGSLRCGVYSISMKVNGKSVYHFSVDEFNFNETRYANSHIDFEERQVSGKRVHRLFLDPNNKFSGYKKVLNKGYINVQKDSLYNISILITDANGNKTELKILMVGEIKSDKNIRAEYPKDTISHPYWLFYNDNYLEHELFTIKMPRNVLYNNLFFTYNTSEPLPESFSSVIHVHNRFTPVHRSYSLAIKAESIPEKYREKALICSINPEGKIEETGGWYINGFVETNVNFFGDFVIMVDSIAPSILPLNISEGKDMGKETSIRFQVEDELSGIASIIGTINGNWVLFEHDPKNNLIFYEFDSKRLSRNKTHELKLLVEDKKGNKTDYSCSFIW